LIGAGTEVGPGDELSKRLHKPTMPTARVQCCPMGVGSGPPASNPRWTGRSNRSPQRRQGSRSHSGSR
jgi:hypothetical protein